MQPKFPGADCANCPLQHAKCVPPVIPEGAEVVVVGEAPGIMETVNKPPQPFVGPSGKLLKFAIRQAGGDPERIHLTNAVLCAPRGFKDPPVEAMEACSGRLITELANSPARTVVAVGRVAANRLREVADPIDGDANWWYWPDVDKLALITSHPAFVLRNPNQSEVNGFVRILGKAIKGRQPHQVYNQPKAIHLETIGAVKARLDQVPDGTWVSADVETRQVRWYERLGIKADHILNLALAWNFTEGYIIHGDLLDEAAPILNDFFKRVKVVGQNAKFDELFLYQRGIEMNTQFDTMLAHYILHEETTHGLKEMAGDYFDIADYEKKLIKMYLKSREDTYDKIPYDKLSIYAAWDVCVTLAVKEIFERQLESQGLLEWPFYNIMMRSHRALTKVQRLGVQVDIPYLEQQSAILEHEFEVRLEQLRQLTQWDEFIPTSPQKVAVILYDVLGLPTADTYNKKKKPRCTDASILKEHLEHSGKQPFIDLLLSARRIKKIHSSYIVNLLTYADVNHRVHANFKLHGTVTGRLAATDPAVQTIPEDNDRYGAMIRSSVIARKGYKLVVADYSQAELRTLAHIGQVPFLVETYARGDLDVHSYATVKVWKRYLNEVAAEHDYWLPDDDAERAIYLKSELEKKSKSPVVKAFKQWRSWTKTYVFAFIYGGSERSLGRARNFPSGMKKEFIQNFNALMPELVEYRRQVAESMRTRGYVQTIFGRKRRFRLITKANEDEARKAACNMPIQSTASDLTMLAMCRLVEEGYRVVLTVHDSILVEAEEDKAEEVAQYVRQVMIETGQEWCPGVRWEADVDVGDRWCDPPEPFDINTEDPLAFEFEGEVV